MASDEGLIFIEGSGPTYATETVYSRSYNLYLYTSFSLTIIVFGFCNNMLNNIWQQQVGLLCV